MFLMRNRTYWLHVFIQTLGATAFMGLVLLGLNKVADAKIIWAAGASTLASSVFLIFCVPDSPVAKLLKIIGGYIVATLVGEGMRLLINFLCQLLPHCHVADPPLRLFELAAALSVGVTFLLMVLFKLEPPPAAGLAVVMVLDIRNMEAMLIILAAAILLTLIRTIFRNQLRRLV